MIRIATPVSHLFDDPAGAKKIMAASDCLECRDRSLECIWKGQELFHSDLQVIHPFKEVQLAHLRRIGELKPDLSLLSFHVASSCSDPVLNGYAFEKGGEEFGYQDMLINAKKNLRVIKELFGARVKIAVENTNYYPTAAYQYITEPGFLTELVEGNDIWFLFDLAHARITAHNKQMVYEEYKKGLPFSRVVQIHLSHFLVNDKQLAYDAHACPGEQEFREAKEVLAESPIEYLTIEYYQDTDKLVTSLQNLRAWL
jgi:hypothetical protein